MAMMPPPAALRLHSLPPPAGQVAPAAVPVATTMVVNPEAMRSTSPSQRTGSPWRVARGVFAAKVLQSAARGAQQEPAAQTAVPNSAPAVGTQAAAPPCEGVAKAFGERLLVEAQEGRLRCFEKALEAARAQHAEEVTRLQESAEELRGEMGRLRAAVADKDKCIEELYQQHAAKDIELKEKGLEVNRLRAENASLQRVMDARVRDNERLTQQLNLLLQQLQQARADADVARSEKEKVVRPLSSQVQELSHGLAVKQKQVILMNREIGEATRRVQEARAEAIDRRERAEQVEEASRHELMLKDMQLQQMQAQLQTQAASSAERERRLMERCRLLQAWCFRMWWGQDSGQDAGPFAAMHMSSSRSGPLVRSSGRGTARSASPSSGAIAPPFVADSDDGSIAKLRARQMLPHGWLGVLRFQSTLFHWLAAETARENSLGVNAFRRDLEAAVRRTAGEVKTRSRQLQSLLQARRDVEHANWQRERQKFEARVASPSSSAAPGHEDLAGFEADARSRLDNEIQGLEAQLADVQLLRPLEELLQYLADSGRGSTGGQLAGGEEELQEQHAATGR